MRPGLGIMEALIAFGAQIDVEPILALVNDPSTSDMVLCDAIFALGVSRDKRVLESLSTFIAQHRFLFQTIQALGYTYLLEAIPLLVRVLEDDTIDCTSQGSLSRENLDDFVIEHLGKLQHPDAFEPIELYARKHLPIVGHMTINALVASDGERAIPFLHEVWKFDPEKRKTILRALLWIGTRIATDKIIELLQPIDGEKTTLLANALWNGRGLDFITGTMCRVGILEAVDSRLVAIIAAHFDEMAFDGMWQAIIAMKYIGTLAARQLLELIADDPKYEEIPFPNATPGSLQTIRQAAIHPLCDLGSEAVIDAILDSLSDQPANIIEFRLTKMDYGLVRDALQRRLHSANDRVLIRLLTLLGTFGDHTVLPALQPYIDDPRQEVADAAYLAEQRILGLAYF
jgi:HEAT repeat protein